MPWRRLPGEGVGPLQGAGFGGERFPTGTCAGARWATRHRGFHEARLNFFPPLLSQFSKLLSRFIQPGSLASPLSLCHTLLGRSVRERGVFLAEVGHRNPQNAGVPPRTRATSSWARPTALMESTSPLARAGRHILISWRETPSPTTCPSSRRHITP